jgi:hypothetical protein
MTEAHRADAPLDDDLFADGACDEKEARQILANCSRATLYRERDAGRIVTVKIGRRTGWLRASLKRRLAAGLNPSASR